LAVVTAESSITYRRVAGALAVVTADLPAVTYKRSAGALGEYVIDQPSAIVDKRPRCQNAITAGSRNDGIPTY